MAPLLTFSVTSPPGPSISAVLIGSAGQSRSASSSGGGSGWQVVDRARKGASTEWLDYSPLVLTIDAFFDGGTGTTPTSVEPQIAILESFELPAAGNSPPMPPLLKLSGPIQHTELTWACSRLSLTGGENGAIRDPFSGLRTQQAFTIELTQYVGATTIVDPNLSPAQQAALSTSANGLTTVVPIATTYTVRSGDSLQSIAATLLGNVGLWPDIALLNGLGNGVVLVAGQTLQLPGPTGQGGNSRTVGAV